MPSDIVSREVRRRMMQSVRCERTPIEMTVSSLLNKMGARHGRNVTSLPGSPDIANKSRRWAVFVHGCFWHGHANCKKTKGGPRGRIPIANRAFWSEKIAANRRRDARKARSLREQGYRVLTVWECETKNVPGLNRKLTRFADGLWSRGGHASRR